MPPSQVSHLRIEDGHTLPRTGSRNDFGENDNPYQGRACMRERPCQNKRKYGQIITHIFYREKGEDKGVIPFNIIVHYPEEEERQQELSKKVATVHAQVVIEKIKQLSCPMEQKLALLDRIIQYAGKEDGV